MSEWSNSKYSLEAAYTGVVVMQQPTALLLFHSAMKSITGQHRLKESKPAQVYITELRSGSFHCAEIL